MSGEGGGVKGAALGKVFKVVMDLFALFGFARHFSVSGLNSFFLHSQGSVNLNKNQLFFLCFHPFSPNHRGICVPHARAVPGMCPGPAEEPAPASSPRTPHVPRLHKLFPSSQNSDPTRKSQVPLKLLNTR